MTATIYMWVVILVLIVVAAGTISRRYGRRLTERQIIASQQIVNAAMREVAAGLVADRTIDPVEDIASTLVANVWGHDVMAFEFIFPMTTRQDTLNIRHEVNQRLAAYADAQKLHSAAPDRPALLVTDVWYDNSRPLLHLDITHIVNEATAAYLRDLRRLNQPMT